MNNIHVNQLLDQMRSMQVSAADTSISTGPEQADFSKTFSNAIDKVNELQLEAGELKAKFEQGDASVNLAEVMIASQKSGVAFQATVQVRNRLVEAYKEIMNMPV